MPNFKKETDFLNFIYNKFRRDKKVSQIMEELFIGLQEIHHNLSKQETQNFARLCLNHPLKKIIHQDPLTFRSFSKPRGYPGDAILLDYIYKENYIDEELEEASPLGQKIYEYTFSTSACRAVRERRNFIAQKIDEMANQKREPHILSLACGHLNEAHYIQAFPKKLIGRFVACDQDLESLKRVEKKFSKYKIECHSGKIEEFAKCLAEVGQFDLIYALGLFDYLPQKTAQELTKIMFNALNPGGTILIANFRPDIKERGYMETFMDWFLFYRDEPEMNDLSAEISSKDYSQKTFIEKNNDIIFLEIEKLKNSQIF